MGKLHFASKLEEAGLRRLSPESVLNLGHCPNAIVVAIATWSDPEIAMLNENLTYLSTSSCIFIFDIDDLSDMSLREKYVPGEVPDFLKTPVMIEYRGGRFTRMSQGLKDVKQRLLVVSA